MTEQNYLIYTDASADIDPAFLQGDAVRFVPMRYMVGEEERVCDAPETEAYMMSFFEAQKAGKETKTSQITPNTYFETFEKHVKEGVSVLYLCLSSGLTTTYDSVCLAASQLAEEYDGAKVIAVDTLSATGGMGLLIETALANREKGLSIEENAENLNKVKEKVAHYFMVDDLMYLKRGGRIPASSAILGSALNIKPLLEIDPEGKLINVDKKRGVKLAIKALVSYYKEKRDADMPNRVYVMHGGVPEQAKVLAEALREEDPQVQISITCLCPVIAAHTGPGLLAAVFFGDR